MLPSNRSQEIEQAKFICFILEKALEIQKEKQVDTIDNFSNKISKFDQFKCIFPWNQLNYLIIDKLKEINQLKNTIKSGELYYKSKTGKKQDILSKYSERIVFKRYRRGNFEIKRCWWRISQYIQGFK